MSLEDRLYGLLLRAYPEDYRAEFGSEMLEAFSALNRDLRARGRGRHFVFLLSELSGTLFHAVRERLSRGGARRASGLPPGGGRRGFGTFPEGWLQDLRHAVRGLARSPLLTLTVVATLAIGIGANTAIYSVVRAVILRPFPYPEPNSLVTIWLQRRGSEAAEGDAVTAGSIFPASYVDYEGYRDRASTLSDVSFVQYTAATILGDPPERAMLYSVAASYFQMLGVEAAVGRLFAPEDADRPANDMVAVLTHTFWTNHFGADLDVLGRRFRWDSAGRGGFLTVVGILPEDFEPAPSLRRQTGGLVRSYADIYSSLPLERRGGAAGPVLARLAEGRSLNEARAEVRAISAGLEEVKPERFRGQEAVLAPLHALRGRIYRREGALFMGAAGLVLLIACADVGILLLIRGNGRRREMAVRASLGGGRWKLIRLMLMEGSVLAVLGAAAGVLLALAFRPALVSLLPPQLPGVNTIEIDGAVLAFTVGLSLVSVFLFAALPALRATRLDLSRELKTAEGSATVRSGLLSRLVVVQVSLATVLLLSGALFARSLLELTSVDQGFDDDKVLIARIAQRRAAPPLEQFRVWDALLEETRRLPGVRSAFLATHAPIQVSGAYFRLTLPDRPGYEVPTLAWGVSENYFDALGIPIVLGVGIPRWSSDDLSPPQRAGLEAPEPDRDWREHLPEIHRVAVVSESLARTVFPGDDALGQVIRLSGMVPLRIVGVARDLQSLGPDHQLQERLDPTFQVYISRAHLPGRLELMVRTVDAAEGHISAIREALMAVDPEVPVITFSTMRERRRDSFAQPRRYVTVVGFFALISLALAVIGLYGVLASSVQERTREIGLRMALGAGADLIRREVLERCVRLTFVGLVLGLGGAVALRRVLQAFLYGMPALDPLVYLLGSAGILLTAGMACYLPARRATGIDPFVALRHE